MAKEMTDGRTDGRMDGHVFTNGISHLCSSAEMTKKQKKNGRDKSASNIQTLSHNIIIITNIRDIAAKI